MDAAPAVRLRLRQSQIATRKSKISGYSFTEVMFAVVVLGIGFIMIAAMFPVAISQSKTTADETTAAAIARGGVNYLRAIATERNMPPTDGAAPADPAPVAPFIGTPDADPAPPHTMTPVHTGSWQAIRGSVVLATDPRFGFVPLYRRETGSTTVQIFIIATQVRARSRYDNTDTQDPGGGTSAGTGNLQARPIQVTMTNDGGGPGVDWIAFADTAGYPGAVNSVAEGTFVVIAADPGDAGSSSPAGTYNGRIYRVGAPAVNAAGAPVPNTWALQPGNDYVPHPGPNGIPNNGGGDDYLIGADAGALIVGRERTSTGDFTGLAQDIAVYTSFIQVRP